MTIRRFLGPVLAVGLLAVAADASAGTLTLRDEAQVFSSSDADQLRAVVARAPFDARLATTSAYADQAGLSRYVSSLVSEPDMVVVGIDPQHHHVQVHFGTGSHIPQGEWSMIERAGNDAFKRGAWEEGGAAIFRAASAAATTNGGVTVPAAAHAEPSSGIGPGLILLLVAGVVLAIVLFAVFSRRRSAGYNASSGYGGPGYGGGPYPGNQGPGPYYGPGGAQGGMGPLGGGLIGAGLGGLAGYELGKMEGERERGRERDEGFFGGGESSSSSTDGGSYDAGGGGSSWDDSGSSGGGGGNLGGGGDSGGGGSDF